MVKEYEKKLEELITLGNDIMNTACEDVIDEDIYDEIENMDMHLGCALRILRGESLLKTK